MLKSCSACRSCPSTASWNRMMCSLSSCKVARNGTVPMLFIIFWLSIICYKYLKSENLRNNSSPISMTNNLWSKCSDVIKIPGNFLLYLSHLYINFGKCIYSFVCLMVKFYCFIKTSVWQETLSLAFNLLNQLFLTLFLLNIGKKYKRSICWIYVKCCIGKHI